MILFGESASKELARRLVTGLFTLDTGPNSSDSFPIHQKLA